MKGTGHVLPPRSGRLSSTWALSSGSSCFPSRVRVRWGGGGPSFKGLSRRFLLNIDLHRLLSPENSLPLRTQAWLRRHPELMLLWPQWHVGLSCLVSAIDVFTNSSRLHVAAGQLASGGRKPFFIGGGQRRETLGAFFISRGRRNGCFCRQSPDVATSDTTA